MIDEKKLRQVQKELNEMMTSAVGTQGSQFAHFTKMAHGSQAVMVLMNAVLKRYDAQDDEFGRYMDTLATILASNIEHAKKGMELSDAQAKEALAFASRLSDKCFALVDK